MDEKMKEKLLEVFASKLSRSVRMYMENSVPVAERASKRATCTLPRQKPDIPLSDGLRTCASCSRNITRQPESSCRG